MLHFNYIYISFYNSDFCIPYKIFKVGLSTSNFFYLLQKKPFKFGEKYVLINLKTFFLFLKCFCLDFLVIYKSGSITKIRLIPTFMKLQPVSKQLQYTYCPISHELKANRQWNLLQWYNITRTVTFLKILQKMRQGG